MSTFEENVTGSEKRDSRAMKRKRTKSSSSDVDVSSSTSSYSSENDYVKQRKRRKGRKNKRVSTNLIKQLISDVNELKYRVASSQNNSHDDDFVDPNVSGELYECNNLSLEKDTLPSTSDTKINININTKTKEPAVPSTPDDMLNKLIELQHLHASDWSSIRYVDVQKSCLHTPGFTNLETNDELKQYDNSIFTANMEKAYASLTYALLKQREALQNELNSILMWINENETLSCQDIYNKFNDTLSKSDYSNAANDTMQLVCGHRAELIQQRRENILTSVKDPVYKAAFRKIPPSVSNLFEADKVSSLLEKAGGVHKVFWHKNVDRYSAPRNDPGTSSRVQTQKKATGKQIKHKKDAPRQPYRNATFRGRGKPTRGRNDGGKRNRAYSPSSHRDRRDGPRRN